jgi:hypothetical protein
VAELYPGVDANSVTSADHPINHNSVFLGEMRRMVSEASASNKAVTMPSKLASFIITAEDQLKKRSNSSAKPSRIPDYVVPATKLDRPRWWQRQEDLWSSQLTLFKETSTLPCLWVAKNACVAGPLCELDHELIMRRVSDVEFNLMDFQKGAADNIKGPQQPPTLLKNTVACSACPQIHEDQKMLRCAQCGNTAYCSAACRGAHESVHRRSCRPHLGLCTKVEVSEDAFEVMDEAWVMVLPADENRRPFAALVPQAEVPSVMAIEKLLGVESPEGLATRLAARDKWGWSIGDFRALTVGPVCRGEGFRLDLTLVSRRRDTCRNWMQLPPNLRASALITDIEQDPSGSLLDVEGPQVKIRGDAVVCRWGIVSDDPSQRRLRFCQKRGLRDFAYRDYDERWGIFTIAKLEGTGKAMCLPTGNNPQGERLAVQLMEQLSNQVNRSVGQGSRGSARRKK